MTNNQAAHDFPVPSDDELIAMQARGELPSDEEIETAARIEGLESELALMRAYVGGLLALVESGPAKSAQEAELIGFARAALAISERSGP